MSKTNYNEVYRGVNKYVDPVYNTVHFEYTRPYNLKRSATAGATNLRGGKHAKPRKILNTTEPGFHHNNPNRTYFVFEETWCEVVSGWTRL